MLPVSVVGPRFIFPACSLRRLGSAARTLIGIQTASNFLEEI